MDVARLVVGRGLVLALIGLAVGGTAALVFRGSMEALLFGVRDASPAVYAGVAALLLMVAVAASLVPARRALRTDPMAVQRAE